MSAEELAAGLPLPQGMLEPGTTFDARLALVPDGQDDDGAIRAHLAVHDALRDARAMVPNGVFAAVAESMASVGTAIAVMADGLHAQGLSNDTSVLADVGDGRIDFLARPVGRGGSVWTWVVEARAGDDAVCAVSRVVIATRAPG